MIDFIVNNLGTIVVSIVVFGIIGLIIAVKIRNKRKGIPSCSGCNSCPMSRSCKTGDGSVS